MSVNFSHPSIAGRDIAAAVPPGRDRPRPLGTLSVDLAAARQAAHACCCSAKPMVIAIMPTVPGRPHPTDLLLCGHHYRLSRRALAAAGATVVGTDGVPVTGST